MKIILALLVLVACAHAYDDEDGVVVLHDRDFEKALSEFDYALVEFYAPWCGHCKRLTPEYVEAAKTLAQTHPNIKLCKVDATVETEVAERHEVQGYPTLKFFIKGQPEAQEFTGGRTASEIVNWLRKKTGTSSTEVNSLEDLKKFIENDSSAVVLFVGPTPDEFLPITQTYEDVTFYHTNNDEIKQHYSVGDKNMIVFVDKGADARVYKDEFRLDSAREFIEQNRFPIVVPFDQAAAQRIFGDGLNAIFLIVSENSKNAAAIQEAFKKVATELNNKITFSVAILEEDLGQRLAEYIGVSEEELPAIRIVQPSNNMRKFVLEGELSESSIRDFVNDFESDKLTAFYKSEPIPDPSHDGHVRIIVGKNFDDVVMDTSKDVLVEYYAPWCGHCQSLAPIYSSLANRLSTLSTIVIAKMDATANEVPSVAIEGFPTIKLYTTSNKEDPIEFDGGREESDFIDFLRKHGTVEIPEFIVQAAASANRHHHDGHDNDHNYDHHQGHDYGHHDHDHDHQRHDTDL